MISYQIKSIMLCACSIVRGVFTSDNLYDFVNLPPDLKFKFAFHMSKWHDYFSWIDLPSSLEQQKTTTSKAEGQTKKITFADERANEPLTE